MEFEKHTGIFSTSGDVASALSTGAINKPYMAIVGNELDWNSQEPQIDYSRMYLTIEALSAGTFTVKNNYDDVVVYYSINGGTWLSTTDRTQLTLSGGDTVRFKSETTASRMFGFNSSILFKVYGNIESMEYGDDFIGKTTVKFNTAFSAYFSSSQGLVSAENLVLPATTLKMGCYSYMFYGCTNLTTGPLLPAKTLDMMCYTQMFMGCTSLTGITCLATDVSAYNCCLDWVGGTSASGTFYKDPGMNNWPTGANGIPTGWTVVDYTP